MSHYNMQKVEVMILSAYIFEPAELENTTLEAKHFSNHYYKETFTALLKLQKKMIPIDDPFIEKEMGNKFNEQIHLEILSAHPIKRIKPYEYQIIQHFQKRQYNIEMKKIETNQDISFLEKINRVKELSEKAINASSSSLFNVKNTSNILAKTPKFFLENILPIQEKEITMISGKGGVGKSFVAIYLCSLLIKEGLKVFAYFSEDSVENTKNRLEILKKRNPELLDFDLMGKDSRPQSFIEKEGTKLVPSSYFYQFQAQFQDYDIILLDPLIAFVFEDENNNVEARFLFNLLNEWCEKSDKTIIALHHHNKSDEVRGASSFIDAIRLHYTITIPKIPEPPLKEKTSEADQEKWERNIKIWEKENEYNRTLQLEKTNHFQGQKKFTIPLFLEYLVDEIAFDDDPIDFEEIEEKPKEKKSFIDFL